MIHWLEIKKFTTDSIISAAAQCAQKVKKQKNKIVYFIS